MGSEICWLWSESYVRSERWDLIFEIYKIWKSQNFNFTKVHKNVEIWPTSWKYAKILKFGPLDDDEIFPTLQKFEIWDLRSVILDLWFEIWEVKFCQIHERTQRQWNFTDFMKVGNNYEILLTSWKYPKIHKFFPEIWDLISEEYIEIMKCCQLHGIVKKSWKYPKKSWNFAIFMKIYINHVILPTSWNYANILKFC